jgi:predicted Zn-dependent protease
LIGISSEQQAALEEAVEADPGTGCFAALAEVHRLAGRLDQAERVARQGLDRKPESTEGRLVLTLALLDQGRIAEAREELERMSTEVLTSQGVSAQPEADSVSEAELDDAFDQAETDHDELIDPNRVAEEAVAHVDFHADTGEETDDADAASTLEPGSAFATATMAELLERQGDEGGAERIRASLGRAANSPMEQQVAADDHDRAYRIETLERWLSNIRGDRP